MLFNKLVEYSNKIKKVSSRNEKIGIIADFLGRLERKEAEIGVDFIAGRIRQGRLNIAWKGLFKLLKTRPDQSKTLSDLIEIDKYLKQTRSKKGKEKITVLLPLFSRLSAVEKKYLVSLILGEVEQGAGEGLVKMAIAKYFNIKDSSMEYAYMHKPDIGKLFVYLLQKGSKGIKSLGIEIFSPVKPMLATIAESIEDVFEEYDDFAMEYKLDGIRIQLHRKADDVKIFSRHLKDITIHFPELVEIARSIPVNEFILDGEAIGIDKSGRPVPFQILAKRTTRKKDIDKMRNKIPVVPKFFDVLYIKRDDLTPVEYIERWKILDDIVINKNYLATRKFSVNKSDGKKFIEDSLINGNEGIMVKLFNSPYRAGKRGKFWFKIKKVHTIDCIILAAEWGHGRRKGWLSNLHLGVLDETKKKFLMVGKTFKGLTDKMLVWLTENLPGYKVHEDSWILYVKPEVVVEIAFNEVQKSPKYDSGYALRFARVKHIRQDKKPNEVNTILDLAKLTRIRSGNEI
ncbi:ATP-dependent DNA ligase [candidate division WOR-3 bacterium]|nr:ATP-dependent DNA ligase [candidate division WOR-3 bacterium]